MRILMLTAIDGGCDEPEGLDAVWAIRFNGDPNIVEVHVGSLRNKLGKDTVRMVRSAGDQLAGAQ